MRSGWCCETRAVLGKYIIYQLLLQNASEIKDNYTNLITLQVILIGKCLTRVTIWSSSPENERHIFQSSFQWFVGKKYTLSSAFLYFVFIFHDGFIATNDTDKMANLFRRFSLSDSLTDSNEWIIFQSGFAVRTTDRKHETIREILTEILNVEYKLASHILFFKFISIRYWRHSRSCVEKRAQNWRAFLGWGKAFIYLIISIKFKPIQITYLHYF